LIAFLKTNTLPRPQAVTTAPTEGDRRTGFLRPRFDEGSVLLRHSDGTFHRLEWSAEKEQTDRRRALPPGEYTVASYWIVRRDAQGDVWYLATNAPQLPKIIVKHSEEQVLPITDKVRLTFRVMAQKEKSSVQASFLGESGGTTLYRNGKRIMLDYRIADTQGSVLASGTLDYG
jgi:hypothetical protein